MSDDPIFPRKDGRGDEALKRLAEDARRNLEAEFQKERICHNCGAKVPAGLRTCPECWILVVEGKVERNRDDETASEVYGPPPMGLEDVIPVYGPPPVGWEDSKIEEYPVRPAYGPPPISIVARKWIWIVVAVAVGVFALLAAAFLLGVLFYSSNR